MKLLRLLRISVFLAAVAEANLYVPNAQLVGESVDVLLTRSDARVQGILEFNDWMTKDRKVVYLPIFMSKRLDPVQLLAVAQVELEIGGRKFIALDPCDAPIGFKKTSFTQKIQWFMLTIDLNELDIEEYEGRPRIRMSYIQPLIDGHFYYLPVIPNGSNEQDRDWRFQMHVRRTSLPPHVASEQDDAEMIGSDLVVFLKNGIRVDIK